MKLLATSSSLVDRLKRMDPARPRQDRAAIERAIRAHLKGLGPRRRRVVWVEDARSGFRHVAEPAHTGVLSSAVLTRIDYVWYLIRFLVLIAVCGGLGSFAVSAPLGVLAAWLAGDRVGMVVRAHIGPPTLMSVMVAATLVGTFYLVLVLLFARNMRRRRAVAEPIEAALHLMQPYWDTATVAAAGQESDVDFWHHVRNNVPFAAHEQAFGEVFGPSIRHITGSQACPMTEAFEAGLFLYWVGSREVVCVPQPVLHVVNGRLHREDGPAVVWASGEGHWFRHGDEIVPPPLRPNH
jgi:hypothetical protein